MEIVPSIHQLKVPIPDNPLEYLNAYLVKTPEGNMLIDTGWNCDAAYDALIRQLNELGLGLADLKYIAITHRHPDHYGLTGRLAPHTNATLVIHEIEARRMTSNFDEKAAAVFITEADEWLRVNGVPNQARPRFDGMAFAGLGMTSTALQEWRVRGGEHLRLGDFDFEIVWTPGHSPGHICFYEANRRVFIVGDHVLPMITPNVSLLSEAMGNPLEDYLRSLLVVEDLPAKVILPAHEGIFHDLPARTAAIRAHHDERTEHILSTINGGYKTAYEVAGTIPWETLGVAWNDLGAQMKRSAVTETLAHLELLRAKGRLTRTLRDDLYWYATI